MLERARLPERAMPLPLDAALGRVLADAVASPLDVPGYDNSQMDGYAVRAADVPGEGVVLPVSQRIPAGATGTSLACGTAARIFTGAPMPEGADTVVMQERCRLDADRVWIPGPVARGDNVRPRGNDIRSGDRVLERGERLFPQHLGLAASLGLASLPVFPRLTVAIFSSGDELRMPGESLGAGQIYNSNRFTLHALLGLLGVAVADLGRVQDKLDATAAVLVRGSREADVVVGSGGVSVGEEDHVKAALERCGEVELWRVAVKPGKPLAYGRVGDADFIGLPGNPVSVFVTFCLFVRPFLLKRMGVREPLPIFWPVRAGFDWPRAAMRREFARARLQRDDPAGMPVATLHPRQGSDVLSSTTWAEGLVEIPEGVTVARGDPLRFLPYANLMG